MKSRALLLMMVSLCITSAFLFSCNDDDDDNDNSVVEQGATVELSESDNTADGYFDGSLYYRIISKSKKTVAVAKAAKDALNVVIPAFVVIDGKKYTVREIDGYAFLTDKEAEDPLGRGYVKSVVWPTTIKNVASRAFFQCEDLKRVDIYDLNVWMKTQFEQSASNPLTYHARLYVNGQELKELTVPENITKILPYAFDGCTSITKVKVHDKVTEIGNGAFTTCNSLTDVDFGKGVKSIGSFAFFACYKLQHADVPDNVTKLGDNAFSSCEALKSISLGNGLKTIEDRSFMHCFALENVTLGTNVTVISDEAFEGCNKIKKMTLPDKVTNIKYDAFRRCKSMKSINFPAGVKEIGSYSFEECDALTEIYSYIKNPNQVTFNFNPFPNPNNTTLFVPKGTLDAYKGHEMWSKLKTIKEADEGVSK